MSLCDLIIFIHCKTERSNLNEKPRFWGFFFLHCKIVKKWWFFFVLCFVFSKAFNFWLTRLFCFFFVSCFFFLIFYDHTKTFFWTRETLFNGKGFNCSFKYTSLDLKLNTEFSGWKRPRFELCECVEWRKKMNYYGQTLKSTTKIIFWLL